MIPGVDFELDTFHLEILTRGEQSAELDPETIERLFEQHIDYRMKLRAELVEYVCPKGAIRFEEP